MGAAIMGFIRQFSATSEVSRITQLIAWSPVEFIFLFFSSRAWITRVIERYQQRGQVQTEIKQTTASKDQLNFVLIFQIIQIIGCTGDNTENYFCQYQD